MAESAALLVDEILPHQPMRQWVLSVPFPLRFLFASQPTVMGKVLGDAAIGMLACCRGGTDALVSLVDSCFPSIIRSSYIPFPSSPRIVVFRCPVNFPPMALRILRKHFVRLNRHKEED